MCRRARWSTGTATARPICSSEPRATTATQVRWARPRPSPAHGAGDGYGDAVVGIPFVGMLVLGAGSAKASPAVLPIYPSGPSAGGSPSAVPTSRVAMGGFDANGDGLGDVVFSLSDSYQPS